MGAGPIVHDVVFDGVEGALELRVARALLLPNAQLVAEVVGDEVVTAIEGQEGVGVRSGAAVADIRGRAARSPRLVARRAVAAKALGEDAVRAARGLGVTPHCYCR